MRLARVRSPEHDHVGVLDLLVGARAAACPEYRRQTDDARGVSSSIAAIDVVAADDRANELLGDVIHLVGGLRAAKHSKRASAAALSRVAQSRCCALEGLVPGGAAQGPAVTHEWMRQPKMGFAHGRVIRAPPERSPPRRLRKRPMADSHATLGQRSFATPEARPVLEGSTMSVDLSAITVYADGRFQRYEDSKVGLLTHGLQYGTGCFEGIRGYWVPEDRELFLVLLRDHFERLMTSGKILTIKLPHTVDELVDITTELCLRNRYEKDVYVRPFAYKAAEDVGVRLHNVPDAFAIIPIPFTHYLDATRGLHVCVSSWRRMDDTMAPPRAKITGLYVNSALAKSEAVQNGYDEAILVIARRSRRGRFGREHFPRASRRALHAGSLAKRPRGRNPQGNHGAST